MTDNNLLEVKTYRQPSGVVVQLRRYVTGVERLVEGRPQEWGACCYTNTCKSYMVRWQKFEKRIGSEVL